MTHPRLPYAFGAAPAMPERQVTPEEVRQTLEAAAALGEIAVDMEPMELRRRLTNLLFQLQSVAERL